MTNPIAAFQNVAVTFGRVRVLEDVTLDVQRGAVLGVVGESGSGKTTLCRVLLGLTAPSGGRAMFEGEEIGAHLTRDRLGFRRAVQMLLQDAAASLSPRMPIGLALEEPLRIHGLMQRRTEIAGLVTRLGLPADILQKFPHQISGGQARRVGVARALLLKPRLLVADEPTAGLDVSVQGELLNLLLDLQRDEALTLLIVSHNLQVVRRVTTRVAVMHLGEVVEEAPTAALFARPAHPYTAALLAASPGLVPGAARIVLRGEMPSVAQPPSGCRFRTRCPVARPRCETAPPWVKVGDGRAARCHFPFSLPAVAPAPAPPVPCTS